MDGGNGGRHDQDAGAVVTLPAWDAGGSGLEVGPDGGITVGSAAAFASDFVYMSNAAEDPISRILITSTGVPYEEARYFAIVPINNHGASHPAIWDHFGQLTNADGRTSPSRTLVDRNGNTWVALRAPGLQAGATRITNVDDNLSQCKPRCTVDRVNSLGTHTILAGQPYTEGTSLNLSSGGHVVLLPSVPSGITIPNAQYVSTSALRPNTLEAREYSCPGHNPNDYDDPVNYDDCVNYSISLGIPSPDPDADPSARTAAIGPDGNHYAFGRAAAIAPNCDGVTKECDVWIGLYYGGGLAHLSFNGTGSANSFPAPFDIKSVVPTPGINPYGISVDCAGIAWTTPPASGDLAAVSTVAVTFIPDGGLPDASIIIPAETLVTQFPPCATGLTTYIPNNSHACGAYGISSDQQERIWIGGYGGSSPASACSFNGGALLAAASTLYNSGPAACATTATLLNNSWAAYDIGNAAATDFNGNSTITVYESGGAKISRGINVDKGGNVFIGEDTDGTAVASFYPDGIDGGTLTLNCAGAGCVAPQVQLNWNLNDNTNAYGNTTIGVDLDANGDPWVNNQGVGYGVEVNPANGHFMNAVKIGSGPYSYSDFTGYALRYITLSRSAYSTPLAGCGAVPSLTVYNAVNYTASVPPGTDLQFDVRVTESCNDPAALAAATDYTVCDSVQTPTSASCPLLSQTTSANYMQSGVIDLSSFNLPQGACMEITVTMTPKICAQNGGADALAKPVIYALGGAQTCAGD
jgi:hypothetical protein